MTVSAVKPRKKYSNQDYELKSESELESDWIRNPSWLELPTVTEYEQKAVYLAAVDPGNSQVAFAFRTQDNVQGAQYIVDWGDGTSDTLDAVYNTWVQAEHTYDFNNPTLAGTNAPATITNSVITRSNHGYPDGYKLFLNDIVGPTNLSMTRKYYIVNSTTNTFQLSETKDGAPITINANGTINLLPYKQAIATVTATCPMNYFYHNKSNYIVYDGADGNRGHDLNWLDAKISLPAAQSFAGFGRGATQTTRYTHAKRLEHAEIYNLGLLNSINYLFNNCISLRAISVLNIPKTCVSLSGLFTGAINLERIPDNIDTSQVMDMSNMFYDCQSLKKLPEMDTSNVTLMNDFAYNCHSIERVPAYDLRSVSRLYRLFSGCSSLQVVDAIFGKVKYAQQTFTNCIQLKHIPKIDFSEATYLYGMFSGCYGILDKEYNLYAPNCVNLHSFFQGIPLEEVTIYAPKAAEISSLFFECRKLKKVKLDCYNVILMRSTFSTCERLFDISEVNFGDSKPFYMDSAFYNCYSLNELPYFDVRYVKHARSAFQNCQSLKKLPNYTFTNVLNEATSMFNGLTALETFDNVQIDFTEITGCTGMFSLCTSIKEYPWAIINLSNAVDIVQLFYANNLLRKAPKIILSSKCTNAQGVFHNCYLLEYVPKIENFGSVTYIYDLFANCQNLKEIPAIDFSGVININNSTFSALHNIIKFEGINLGAGGVNQQFYIPYGKLSGAELDNMFTNLADISSGPSRAISITAQSGKLNATPSIATAKGWTVTI